MKIHLRTAFGVSTTFYSSNGQPFQVAVQGNGAAPALWLFISIFLIWYLHQQKIVTAITSLISKLCQYLAALLYVDDTDLYVFNNGVNSTQDIVLKDQRLLNAWHEALKFTGGDLKLSKFYWTLQDYLWQNGTFTYTSSTSSTISINAIRSSTTIKHVPTGKMRILVGVPIIPSNDSHDIVVFYQDKIKDYIFYLKSTNLSPRYVFFGYKRFWLPSIAFAAPVLTIPHGGSILAPLHKALLPKLKIMCTFPLVMRSTPSELRGLNLRSLEITSGVQAIHHLVSLFTSNTPSKLLLITAIEYHQLEVGVEQLFLSASYAKLSMLATSTWVTHLWEFLHLHCLELCLPTLNLPYSSCNNNATITDFLSSFGWKDEKATLQNYAILGCLP